MVILFGPSGGQPPLYLTLHSPRKQAFNLFVIDRTICNSINLKVTTIKIFPLEKIANLPFPLLITNYIDLVNNRIKVLLTVHT